MSGSGQTCRERSRVIVRVHHTRRANQDGARIPVPNSPLSIDAWESALSGYWNAQAITDSMKFGWDIGIISLPEPHSARQNHPSARNFPDDVRHYINTELMHGSIIGPLSRSDLPFAVSVSLLDTVPKAGSNHHHY